MPDNYSKRKKDKTIDKSKLWELFDQELKTPEQPLECVYSDSTNENCRYVTIKLKLLIYLNLYEPNVVQSLRIL